MKEFRSSLLKFVGLEKPTYQQTYPNPEIQKQLEKSYEIASQKRGFPDDKCSEATQIVAGLVGFDMVDGSFRVDKQSDRGIEMPHAWSEDPEETIVDFTAVQFNPHLKRKNRLPDGILVVGKGDPLHERYIPEKKIDLNNLRQKNS